MYIAAVAFHIAKCYTFDVPLVKCGDAAAAITFYGRPLDTSDTAKIHEPAIGLYRELNLGIAIDAVPALGEELENNKVPHEVLIYPGSGRAFFNDTCAQASKREAAKDVWPKTPAWFRKYLTA